MLADFTRSVHDQFLFNTSMITSREMNRLFAD